MVGGVDEQDLDEIKALGRGLAKCTEVTLKRIRRARSLFTAHGPLIAFVHIPKTAGGTATTMFARAYSKPAVHAAGNFMRGPEKTAQKVTRRPGGWEAWHRRGGRVTVGHVPFGLFRQHLPDDVIYMTFLREPVDRVLSHYYRHVHSPEMTPAERAERRQGGRATAASIDEALVEQRLPQLTNLSTRFLCGHPAPMEKLPASALDDAKANLRRFAFVGIQERFEESIVLLQRALGLELTPYLNRHVSAEGGRPAVDEISAEQRALIEEYNRLDVELYDFGLHLFEEAVATADDGFAGDVERLRASNAELNEDATRKARDWLERELPAGTTRPIEAFYSSAEAAGVSFLVLRVMVRRLPSIENTVDDSGGKILRRHDTAP